MSTNILHKTVLNLRSTSKIILLSLVGCMFAINSFAFDAKQQISKANDAYKNKKFEQAISLYKSVVDSGYQSAELYFNLGNAYFRTNDIKRAILYYEKARLLNPSDKDIAYNLELTRSYTIDKIEELPELFLITWLKDFRNLFPLGIWTTISIISFCLTLVFALIYLISGRAGWKKTGFWIGSIAMFVMIVSLLNSYSIWKGQTAHNTAIIFTPTVNIKSSPDESGTNLFILHEGTKVQILYKGRDWSQIKIADGNQGYVRNVDMEVI